MAASVKRLRVEPLATQGQVDSRAGVVDALDPGHVDSLPPGEALAQAQAARPPAPLENNDPLRQRIFSHRRNFWRWLAKKFERPELTPEEKAIQDERERRRQLVAVLRKESVLFMDRIRDCLNRLDLCYRYKKSDHDFLMRGIKSIGFETVRMAPDAIYLKVDTRLGRLPRGISVMQLITEEVLTDLSISCQHRVRVDYSENHGVWYIIERASGVLGIPSHVQYQDMIKGFPASADGLSIPMGMTSNSRPVYKSLGVMYSMLVGGTIGAGKSNVLNVILCTLILRNSPDRLKLLLVDLKGGLEFSFYEGIPHLLSVPEVAENGICYKREQVPDVLRWLLAEGERRISVMRAAGYKDIGRYNQHNKRKHMAHLVVLFDEYADIRLDSKGGKESEELITNIAQRFRAVGIHVILCTQVPKSEIISTRIKGVLPAKLAYSCPTNQASMAILDNGHAKGLTPAGRCILQYGEEITLQSPLITDQMIKDIVDGAKAGHFELAAKRHDVTDLEIQTHALEVESGFLSLDRLFQVYRDRGMTYLELMALLKSWEDKEFIIGSSLYRVMPASGARARRLVAVEVGQEDPEPEGAANDDKN